MKTKTTKKTNIGTWIETDPDTNQYGRQLTATLFEFKEDGKSDTLIELSDYPVKEQEHIINSYGYTLLNGEYKVPSLTNIHKEYGASANWIIAECIFESLF